MTFESLWPLLFLIAVPVIIILYLLKPRGVDYRISSSLLWEKLFKNQHSKTFFEKFVHNILMYLQILITLLLILAFMSPYINVDNNQGGRVVFLIDTSASMQHDNGSGITRLEEAVRTACDFVDASKDTTFSIVTNDNLGTELLAVGLGDKAAVKQRLREIECSDASGNLSDAQGIIETFYSEIDENGGGENARIIVLTDASGAESAMTYAEHMSADLLIAGEAVSNIANEFTVYSVKETGTDVVVQVTNYGMAKASFDVSLYAGEDSLLGVQQVTLQPGETSMCLFQDIAWDTEYLKSEVSGIRFDGQEDASAAEGDSLASDNVSYAVRSGGSLANGILIGSGNTFIERAYRAVTGSDIVRAEQEPDFNGDAYNLAIYDAKSSSSHAGLINRLCFEGEAYASGELRNVRLEAAAGELTAGLEDFTIGVNRTNTYELPEWAHSFMMCNDQCVAYYGEHDGIREIVLGFDIRESDFPLMAEFPVFMANAIGYLSDTSLLSSNMYEAGEKVVINPKSDIDVSALKTDTSKAGIYYIETEEGREYYAVCIETSRESDGSRTAEDVTGTKDYSGLKVKKNLRNIFLFAALLLLILEWLLYLKQMNRLKNPQRFYLIIRCAGLLLLILAIIGISIPKYSNRVTTVFVVDLSKSNQDNLEKMEQFLVDMISEMPGNNQYGIVTFGRDAQIEQFLTERNMTAGLMTVPDDTATNLEEAVYRAMAMIPSDSAGRLVLLTDGCETKGNVMNTASAVVSNEIELKGILYENMQGTDAYIEAVKIPSYLHPGDNYSVEITVASNYDTEAEISLVNGGESVMASQVHLNRGTNRFVFEQTVTGENIESFQVVINAPGDTCAENDAYHAYAVVEAAPKLLLIAGMGENTSAMSDILTQAGCDFDIVSAEDAPDNLTDMLVYKNIILQNVFLSDLPEGFLEELDSYIKDYGCGLVCCGGEDSFAMGGYRESILEEVLPVDMMLRGVDEVPSTAMVMVVDRSGSMVGGTSPSNLDMAITAAVEAVELLRSEDYVGVLSFDTECIWETEITQAEDKDEIIEQLESIAAGGGTEIKPALEEAYDEIKDCDVSVRHVVLLTDGMGETTDFRDVTQAYQEAGITLSTVAVGNSSDQNLLNMLAQNCGGRYYYTDDASEIPRIFAQEVFLSGDTYLQNGEYALQVNGSNDITAGLFTEGWPILYGYISASPKNASNVLIASDKQDPILTVWQYGLGKTVAWNTDVTNQWTGGFAGEEDYIQLWRRIIDYSSGNTSLGDDNLSVLTLADQTRLTYEAQDYTGQTTIEAVYEGTDGQTGEIQLHAIAPGVYEAEIETIGMGIYQFNVRRLEEGNIVNAVTASTAVQFADEYRFDVSNANVNAYLENYGEFLKEGDAFWTKPIISSKESYDLTNYILALLILLFLADVAVRRFQIVPGGRRRRRGITEEETIQGGSLQPGRNTAAGSAVLSQEPPQTVQSGNLSEETKRLQGRAERNKKIRPSKAAGKKRAAEQPDTLDTSQLLRKKDERNIT